MEQAPPQDVPLGADAVFRKTISESDMYLYAGITGDMSPNHIDEEFMKRSKYGRRVVHGTLLIGLMSGAAARMVVGNTVSRGYDRVRFLAPVYPGDTIETQYTLTGYDAGRNRLSADVVCRNQDGVMVASAVHLRAFFTAES